MRQKEGGGDVSLGKGGVGQGEWVTRGGGGYGVAVVGKVVGERG